jgi:hypothetical protein
MRRDISRLLAVGGINGAVEPIGRLLDGLDEEHAGAVAVVANIGAAGRKPNPDDLAVEVGSFAEQTVA